MGSNRYTPGAAARCPRGPRTGTGAQGQHPAAEGGISSPGFCNPSSQRQHSQPGDCKPSWCPGDKAAARARGCGQSPGQLNGLLPATAHGSDGEFGAC